LENHFNKAIKLFIVSTSLFLAPYLIINYFLSPQEPIKEGLQEGLVAILFGIPCLIFSLVSFVNGFIYLKKGRTVIEQVLLFFPLLLIISFFGYKLGYLDFRDVHRFIATSKIEAEGGEVGVGGDLYINGKFINIDIENNYYSHDNAPSQKYFYISGEHIALWSFYFKKESLNNSDKKLFYYAKDPDSTFIYPKKKKGHIMHYVHYLFKSKWDLRYGITEKRNYDENNDEYYNRAETVYYKIYSVDKKFIELAGDIINNPSIKEYSKIRGIEISKGQFDYILKNKLLDLKAPNLTSKQIKYVKSRE
jgi:energy-coupling factor transporter transmembrane protein EcfT